MNNDKTIELLNSTGIPFQDWVAHCIGKVGCYHYEPEVPYSISDYDGTIDIVAAWFRSDDHFLAPFQGNIFLVIEAKRADPSIKNWLFVKDVHKKYHKFYNSSFISISKNQANADETHVENGLTFPTLGYRTQDNFDKCINGFEYNEKFVLNRSSENKIHKPFLQVHRGLNGFASGTPIIQKHKFDLSKRKVYLPIVVITANIFTVDYNPSDIELPGAVINPSKANLSSKKWITYEYPLSNQLGRLQNQPLKTEKLTTFIVQANSWEKFLNSVFVVYGVGSILDCDIL
ncbi:MAG: hypothetical protein AAB536_02355 [Patescibacteria group bacterium]